jgi:threonyl-tRNA synthetase
MAAFLSAVKLWENTAMTGPVFHRRPGLAIFRQVFYNSLLKGRIVAVIRLPDGSERRYEKPVTVGEVAASIGAGLGRAALAGKVNGRLVDVSAPIESDSDVKIVTDKDAEGLEVIRHSTAHLLAHAVNELFPDAQVTIGPVIEDGFYYDFSYKRPFTPEDLERLKSAWPKSASAT